MKKKIVFISALLVISCFAKSQISYVTTYSYNYLFHIHFPHAGYKLVYNDQANNQILLLNYNNTIYKTINVPVVVGGATITYLTEDLFDTDPSTFEFMQSWYDVNGTALLPHVRIYREDGTLLFSRDTLGLAGQLSQTISDEGDDLAIYKRGNTVYLRLSSIGLGFPYPPKTELYKLSGHLSNELAPQQERASYGSENALSPEVISYNFPNPSSNSTKIYYQLPEGSSQGLLVLSDMNGNIVKQFEVSAVFNYITLSTLDLPSGTYNYSIQTTNGIINGTSVVVIH